MRKISLALIFIFGLNISLMAGENSRATFGDIKEAVYKLIILNKKNMEHTDKLDSKVNTLDITAKNILDSHKEDKYDRFIAKFVTENKNILVAIEK